MRMRTIKLAHGVPCEDHEAKKNYRVLVVKNSTQYDPGQILSETEVAGLCQSSTWDVTIVSLHQEGASR